MQQFAAGEFHHIHGPIDGANRLFREICGHYVALCVKYFVFMGDIKRRFGKSAARSKPTLCV
jgi:hypothetical protein